MDFVREATVGSRSYSSGDRTMLAYKCNPIVVALSLTVQLWLRY